MTLNGPINSIDSGREAVAPGDTVRGISEEYRPSIDEYNRALVSVFRGKIARCRFSPSYHG
jgi:hypothetical protein